MLNKRFLQKITGISCVLMALLFFGVVFYSESTVQNFNPFTQTISALGVSSSANLFNTMMISVAIFSFFNSFMFFLLFKNKWFSVASFILSIGILGVGIFPASIKPHHVLAAFTAFLIEPFLIFGSYKLVEKHYKQIVILVGIFLVLASVLFSLGFSKVIGIGLIERMYVYPIFAWEIIFGLYLILFNK
jgi:hypothetical membrane protein